MRDMLLEELMAMGMFLTQSNTPVSLPAFQIREPVQDIPDILLGEPLQSNFYGDGQRQTFLNIGKAMSYPLALCFWFESSSPLMVLGYVGVIGSLNIIDMVKWPPKLPFLCVLQLEMRTGLPYAPLTNSFGSPQTV